MSGLIDLAFKNFMEAAVITFKLLGWLFKAIFSLIRMIFIYRRTQPPATQ